MNHAQNPSDITKRVCIYNIDRENVTHLALPKGSVDRQNIMFRIHLALPKGSVDRTACSEAISHYQVGLYIDRENSMLRIHLVLQRGSVDRIPCSESILHY